MNLKHVVITAVARDDLKDGGADHFARTITAIREMDPSIVIEVLVPDFHADDWCIQTVLNARPRHLQSQHGNGRTAHACRAFARKVSDILASFAACKGTVARRRVVTKSGVMLGLGEKETELFQTMDDLREVGCEVLTMGQYLRPSPKHLPVVEYITPEQFNYYGDIAAGKVFSTSPRGRWSAALITRPIFIRLCGDNRRREQICRGSVRCPQQISCRAAAVQSLQMDALRTVRATPSLLFACHSERSRAISELDF